MVMTERTQRSDRTDGSMAHDLTERVFMYLLDEGSQSTCQISVALGEPLEQVAAVLHALEHEGARIRRTELPPSLQKYQVFDRKGQPAIFLYEAVQSRADLARRVVYTI